MDAAMYRFLNHLDAPKRWMGFTLDEVFIAVLSFLFLIFAQNKIIIIGIGLSVVMGLRVIKKGKSPRHLLVLAYWYLPSSVTQFILPKLPPSHCRVFGY